MVLAIGACGDDGAITTTSTGAPDAASAGLAGLELPGVAASAFAAADGQVAVFNGSPGRGEGMGLRLVSAGGDAADHPLPVEEALVYLHAWWGPRGLHLSGVRCPGWTEVDEPVGYDPNHAGFLNDLCGEPVLVAASWETATAEWSAPVELGPAPSGYFFPSSRGDQTVLSIPDDPLVSPAELLLFDGATGGSVTVPGPPIEAATFCLSDDSHILAVEAFGAPSEEDLPPPEPGTDDLPPLPGLTVMGYQDGAWNELSVDPAVESVEGCSGDGGVVVEQAGNVDSVLRRDGDRAVTTGLPERPVDGVTSMEQALTGELLLIQDDEANSDGAEEEHFWMLEGAEWVDLGAALHATGDYLVVLADWVLTLPRGGSPLQPVTLRGA